MEYVFLSAGEFSFKKFEIRIAILRKVNDSLIPTRHYW